MILRALHAECIKGKHAPVWLAFIVLPLIPAGLGTANYLGNLSLLKSSWYSLWTQHTLFASFFFLPALLAVYCAWQWRLEHSDHNFNSFLTAPVPAWTLYLGKLIPAIAVSILAQAIIGVLFVISGKLAGINDPLPPELLGWLLCGALGSVAVCAVQLPEPAHSLFCDSSGAGTFWRHCWAHGDGAGLGHVLPVFPAGSGHACQQSQLRT